MHVDVDYATVCRNCARLLTLQSLGLLLNLDALLRGRVPSATCRLETLLGNFDLTAAMHIERRAGSATRYPTRWVDMKYVHRDFESRDGERPKLSDNDQGEEFDEFNRELHIDDLGD